MKIADALFGIVAIGVVTWASDARAYCRAASCPAGVGTVCTPAESDDCGAPLYWGHRCVGYRISENVGALGDFATVTAAIDAGFSSWEAASCGPVGKPSIELIDLGSSPNAIVEYNGPHDSGNDENLIFVSDPWPHPEGTHNVALTTVTYDAPSGLIYDADTELNGDYAIALSDPVPEDSFDLTSIMTHEAGHFLGLAHSGADPTATMNAVYEMGSTETRTLEADDIAAICAVYLPTGERSTGQGNVMNDGCLPAASESTCPSPTVASCAMGSDGQTQRPWILLAALGALVRRRKRR